MSKKPVSKLLIIAVTALLVTAFVTVVGFPDRATPTLSTTLPDAAPETLLVDTTAPPDTTPAPLPTTTSVPPTAPRSTTPPSKPVASTVPPQPSLLSAQQIAERMANDLTKAFWSLTHDTDPKIIKIWNRALKAGASVSIDLRGLTYTPPSLTEPRFSQLTNVSKDGTTVCVRMADDLVFGATLGPC